MMYNSSVVGYAYACGDVLHKGHILHFNNCKALCDFLIVGVLTDDAVMEKKPHPILSFDERLTLISAIKNVDLALPQNTYSPLPNAIGLKINILFESVSHHPDAIKDAEETMKILGGKVLVMPYYPEQSSTKIKKDIIKTNEK